MTKSIIKSIALISLSVFVAMSITSCKQKKAAEGASVESPLPAGVQKYQANGFTVIWIADNAESKANPVSLFSNVPEGAAEALGITEGIPGSMSAFLIQENDKNILFDTGMGGQLFASLEALGVAPSDISAICITHLHGDHTGGLVKEDTAAFPNADVYLSRIEYEASGAQTTALEAYKDKLHLFEFGDTILGDIKTIDGAGHTPGHALFQKGNVLIVGDIMHGVALQIEYPEVCARFDSDQQNSIAVRKMALDLAKSQKLLMCGMHFPEGGVVDFR